METNELKEILEVFALNPQIRNKLASIIRHLYKHGKTIDDYLEYTDAMNEAHRKQIAEQEKYQAEVKANSIPCPECNFPMALRPVNVDAGTQTGDDSKTVWICGNNKCMYMEYSEKAVEQWREELKRKVGNGNL